VTPAGWAAFVWTVVVPVYIGWTLWHRVIEHSGVARASVFMYLVPIVGGATSWVVLGEACGPLKIAGAALTLGGIAVARRREESRAHAAPTIVRSVRGRLERRDALSPPRERARRTYVPPDRTVAR